MSLQNSIQQGWQEITRFCKNKEIFWYRSPQILLLKRRLKPLVELYAKGRVLDAGAGTLAYKYLFNQAKYLAVDKRLEQGLDCVADLEHLPFREGNFDTVFCSQVLEHLSSPFDAVSEFYRVLKPNGTLILSVPHLSCYHELPYDYYRFTASGISFLLKKAGFRIILVESCGGLFCFMGHIFSHIMLGYTGRYRLLRNFALSANSIFSRTVVFMDSLLIGSNNIAPLNIIVISTK